MIITSIPAGELIRILKEEECGPFKYYCFLVAREIDSREVLSDVFEHYASLDSVTAQHLLFVLFYDDPEAAFRMEDVKRGLSPQTSEALARLYFHDCQSMRLKLLTSMDYYRDPAVHDVVERRGWRVAGYDQFSLDHYLRWMTLHTQALKEAFRLREADLPCMLIWDRDQDESALLRLQMDTSALHVYEVIRELIARTIEREEHKRGLERQLEQEQHNLRDLDPNKPGHLTRIADREARIEHLQSALSEAPAPEALADVLASIANKQAWRHRIKTITSHLPSLRDVFAKIVEILTRH